MKLRKFLNSERKSSLVQELKNDFMPLAEKVTGPVTNCAKKNPRTTFSLMILVVVINIIFLFKYSDASVRKKGIGIADFPWQHLKSASQEVMPDIPVSFENIQKVRAIRDSLAY